MNTFEGRVDDGTFRADGLSFAVRDIADGPVVLGIRPEHFHLKPVDGESPALRLQLNVIEPLGNDMDCYMASRLNDHVVGRVEATSGLVIGQETTVYVDSRKVHFFEPGETGMNLSLTSNEPANATA